MVKSIQHFNEVSTGVFGKIITEFYKKPTDMASLVLGITEELHKVGIQLIQETLEEMDQLLCKSGKRQFDWIIERHDTRHLLTSLGNVTFRKTLFTHKQTGEMRYLLDGILGLENPNGRKSHYYCHRQFHPGNTHSDTDPDCRGYRYHLCSHLPVYQPQSLCTDGSY